MLLLEAGTAKRPLFSRIPAAFRVSFKGSKDWNFETDPEPALDGRRLFVPRGKLLGGSSAINAMIYIRGNPADYDGWAELGARGWSYADVLPLFEASALHVEQQRSPNPISELFVEACAERGISRNPDFNSGVQDGAGLYRVTQKRGERHSAADAYLFPAFARPNLRVRGGALALRVVLDGDRATGVEYSVDGVLLTARASHSVVLAAGALGSPQLLLLSGIGAESELRRISVPVRAPLPGVGENLQDHPIVAALPARVTADHAEECGDLRRPRALFLDAARPLTSNIAEAGAFVRSPWAAGAPDIQFHFSPGLFIDHGFERPRLHGYSFGPTLIAPRSRGRLWLRTSDPRDAPALVGNHLSAPEDRRALLWALELSRSLAEARAFDGVRGGDYWRSGSEPTDWEAYLRRSTELLYHPSGTCRMGNDELAVVDTELRVRGIRGLFVADASVMPVIVRGNTHAPTVMIAEHLAARLSRG